MNPVVLAFEVLQTTENSDANFEWTRSEGWSRSMGDRVVTIANPAFLKLDLDRLCIEQLAAPDADDNQDEEASGQATRVRPRIAERKTDSRGHVIVGSVPVEDLSVLIVDSWGVTLTHELLARLSEENVAVVLCDPRHLPTSMLLPLYGHSAHARTLRQQIECSAPKQKRLWQQIVQAKITEQARTLEACRGRSPALRKLRAFVPQVGSGDPMNLEGQAARLYFPALFGEDFERDTDRMGTNAMLNYGYAIMRAMVARALVGAGLHPALGVHHIGPMNPFNLADDAIEPLRALVDQMVWDILQEEGEPEKLTPALKRKLLEMTVCTVKIAGTPYPILTALERYAASIREGVCGDLRKLAVPHR